jgi:hypothetical protein
MHLDAGQGRQKQLLVSGESSAFLLARFHAYVEQQLYFWYVPLKMLRVIMLSLHVRWNNGSFSSVEGNPVMSVGRLLVRPVKR